MGTERSLKDAADSEMREPRPNHIRPVRKSSCGTVYAHDVSTSECTYSYAASVFLFQLDKSWDWIGLWRRAAACVWIIGMQTVGLCVW